MAYEFDLHSPDAFIPEQDRAGTYAIEFTLGYDPDENAIIVMSVMLSPTPESGVFDLSFGIRRKEIINNNTFVNEPDYSVEAVARYIPKRHRKAVHQFITDCAFHLAEEVFPDYIIMVTAYTNLPEKALAKYEPIVLALLSCGYELSDRFRDREGYNYWNFRNEFGASL